MFFKKNIVGLLQLITDATRITPKSSSIIDLIFVSEPDKIQQSGVLPVGFSDHMIIFCTHKLCRLKIGKHKSVKMLKNYDKTVFNNSLSSVDWNSIYVSTNVDEAFGKIYPVIFIHFRFSCTSKRNNNKTMNHGIILTYMS